MRCDTIEEQVLSLINEIDKSLSDPENFNKNRNWNKPKKKLHAPGATWKTKSGKTAKKDTTGKISYMDSDIDSVSNGEEHKPKTEAADPNGDHHISSAEYDARLDLIRAKERVAKPGSKSAQQLPITKQNLEKAKQRAIMKAHGPTIKPNKSDIPSSS